MPIAITQENADQYIKQSSKPVVVDVYAVWCGQCQMMAPIFDKLEQELGEKYTFAKLNVDEARELSIQLGVSSVPTFLFIKNGTVVGNEVGSISQEDLEDKITAYLG
jgi:thioredoxin 1